MNQEPSLTDEVIVIFVDGEVVDGFLAWERGYRDHPAPAALQRLYEIADAHVAGGHPGRRSLAALDPEGMLGAGPQRRSLALDAHVKERVLVQRGEAGGPGLTIQK
jgi:hypothetical protein